MTLLNKWLRRSAVLLIATSLAACSHTPDFSGVDTPLVRLEPTAYPRVTDDMLFDQLETAIAQSLVYYRRLPSDTRFRYGDDDYTAAHLIRSLTAFSQVLATSPSVDAINALIRDRFIVYQSVGRTQTGDVLFTGYYEPLLRGSRHPGGPYQYPLYPVPDDLIRVDLGAFSKRFSGERIFGRWDGRSLKPYHDRQAIDMDGVLADTLPPLVWLDDPIDRFFLHIQGSGKVYLDTGDTLHVQYAAPNGRPYVSIGKALIDSGAITAEAMSMQAIRQWLENHPDAMDDLLAGNPSYVFFRAADAGPYGSINVRLTPGRAIATDRRIFPKGALAFIRCQRPLISGDNAISEWIDFGRFVLNQDTGGAILGPGRADVFWGNGPYAEIAAGHLKHTGKLFFLVLDPAFSTDPVETPPAMLKP